MLVNYLCNVKQIFFVWVIIKNITCIRYMCSKVNYGLCTTHLKCRAPDSEKTPRFQCTVQHSHLCIADSTRTYYRGWKTQYTNRTITVIKDLLCAWSTCQQQVLFCRYPPHRPGSKVQQQQLRGLSRATVYIAHHYQPQR